VTDEFDVDDVPERLIPEEQVEAILSGGSAGADLSEPLASVAAVLQRAQQAPSPLEQLEANAAIASIVDARRAATTDELAPRRTRMLPTFSKRTAAIVVGVTLWSTLGVAAATDHLPFATSGASTLQELADETTTTEATPTSDDTTTTIEGTTSSSEDTTTTTADPTTSSSEDTTTTADPTTSSEDPTTTAATTTAGGSSTVAGTVAAATTLAATRGVGPDPNGPAHDGLCNAYMNGLAKGKPKNPQAPPWRNLIAAAGGADSVADFCGVTTTAATTTDGGTATTVVPTTIPLTAAASVVHGSSNSNGNGNGNGKGHGHG
jgi:hypothetical protein